METQDQILQAIFDQAAVGIAQIGLDGTWLRVNSRYCQMLGYSEAELRTKTLHDISHPDDCKEVLDVRRQLLEGVISSHCMEKRYIRRDGTVFWGRLNRSLVRDHDNLPKYFIAVVEDITGKIQAEHELRDRERQLVLAQSAGRLGLWDRDLRTGVTVTSSEFARLHGVMPNQLPVDHEGYMQLVHPDDRERVQAEYQESIERTHMWDTEFRVTWPDGSVHWLLAKGQVFFDDAGRPVRLAGINLDITERKETEAALQESERRYKEMFDITSDCIFLLDVTSDGRFKVARFNPAGEAAVGFSTAETAGRFVEDVVGEEVAQGFIPTYRRCVDAGVAITSEDEVNLPVGRRYFHTNFIPVRNAAGRIHRIVAVARDITERRQSEALLRESEERFRNMADTAPVMIWVAGPDKLCTFFNKRCLDFTGLTMEQKLGDGWIASLHPEDRERFVARYSSSFDARQDFETVFRLRRAGGEYRWVLTTGAPRFASGGIFAGFIGSCVDITELRRTQGEALARQKLEDLGVLAGGIAHDFNNLLGSILAEAELVQADLAAGLSPDEEVARIKTVAIRGAEIVRELMIYAGQDQASVVEPVDLSRLAAEMLELMKVSISKCAVLKINLDKDLPTVWGNASQIRQVLMNLVINASEAIGEKEGVIRVTTSRVTADEGPVSNNGVHLPAGDYVRLEVSDNGCGLTEEAKSKIFDPFFTTKFAGRGLGLAVVQGIVRAHGGAIDVVSAPGQGATFQVLLSCNSTKLLEVPSTVTSATAAQSNVRAGITGTVLVVEDEEVLRLAVSEALRKRGFSVMEARDGTVAMDLMRTNQDDIDVILLDVTLPGTSSREVFEEARRMRANPKVVLSSAYDRRTVEASFSGLPITQFIRKPFGLDDLAGTLRDALAS